MQGPGSPQGLKEGVRGAAAEVTDSDEPPEVRTKQNSGCARVVCVHHQAISPACTIVIQTMFSISIYGEENPCRE